MRPYTKPVSKNEALKNRETTKKRVGGLFKGIKKIAQKVFR